MNATQKRKLDNELLVLGLKGLHDPELIQQLADLVSGWPGDKNQFFIELLNECDGDKRYEMYNAMAPKLRFKPLSFIEVETSIAMRAGELVSQRRMRVEGERQKPIEIEGREYVEVAQEHATRAVVRLQCHKCTRTAAFVDATPVSAMLQARSKGWVRDLALNKEICPKCPAIRAGRRLPVMATGSA